MIRILHFGFHSYKVSGIVNQLAFERAAADALKPDIVWDTRFFTLHEAHGDFIIPVGAYSPTTIFSTTLNYLRLRNYAFKWLKKNYKNYDAVLLRYSISDPIQYLNRYWFSNIFTVHHTFEIEESRLRGGIRGTVKALIEQTLGKQVIAMSKGIIGVVNEIVDYENARLVNKKPGYCYPNGIDLSFVKPVNDMRDGKVKLLVIASKFQPWHGLDLLINAFSNSHRPFEMHIVGSVGEDIIKCCAGDVRFNFHGVQDYGFIQCLAQECDVGLSSFALDRYGRKEACTLKVREYLALGLPVYAGDKDSALPDDFPFYRKGAADAAAILDYAKECRKFSRGTVHNLSAPFIDKKNLMVGLVEWITKIL